MRSLVNPHTTGRRSLSKGTTVLAVSVALTMAAIGSPSTRSVARRAGWYAGTDVRIAARIVVRYLANARG